MTLFGRELGVQEISTLIFLLLSLVFWVMAMRNEMAWTRWFRNWEAERKARREAQLAEERGDASSSEGPRGPWG